MIQRTSAIKFLRYLGIFCAITMGFYCIVATSEDDAEDAAAFDEDLTVASITVNDTDGPQELYKNCEKEVSINGAAEAAGVDVSDIKSLKLNGLKARYKDVTTDPVDQPFSCTVTITQVDPVGDNNATLPTIDIDQASSEWSNVKLSDDNLSAINYYIANRDSSFDICVECDVDIGLIDTFTATIEVSFDVEITPDL